MGSEAEWGSRQRRSSWGAGSRGESRRGQRQVDPNCPSLNDMRADYCRIDTEVPEAWEVHAAELLAEVQLTLDVVGIVSL